MAKEYIDREALLEFLHHEIKELEDLFEETIGEDDRLNQAVGSRITALLGVLREVRTAQSADVAEVRHGTWETVYGVLTPGGDPLKRCPFCKSRESEHLDGVEFPSRWMFCPICGAMMDGKEGAEDGPV